MSSQERDDIAPLIDRRLGARLEFSGNFGTAAEELNRISGVHGDRVYSALDKKVKHPVSRNRYGSEMEQKPVPGWGKRLKDERKKRDLTLVQVATFVGATKSAVSQWEREEIKDIKAGYVQRFSELYKKPPAWIIGRDLEAQEPEDVLDDDKKPLKPVVVTDISPARLDLIRMYGRLPQELRSTVRMLIETLSAMHSERYAKFEHELANTPRKPPKK